MKKHCEFITLVMKMGCENYFHIFTIHWYTCKDESHRNLKSTSSIVKMTMSSLKLSTFPPSALRHISTISSR